MSQAELNFATTSENDKQSKTEKHMQFVLGHWDGFGATIWL